MVNQIYVLLGKPINVYKSFKTKKTTTMHANWEHDIKKSQTKQHGKAVTVFIKKSWTV